MKAFAGKVAVITGAASGLGKALAWHAHRLGMRLVLADIEAGPLEVLVAEMGGEGARVIARRCDVALDGDVAALHEAALAQFGTAHLLFNNAGVGGQGGFLWENSANDWRWILDVNVLGVAHGIRHFVRRWVAAGADGEAAHVVNTASIAGWLCAPLMGSYNASKSAVVSLSETLYNDLRTAGSSIGVSVLCPAYFPTAIFEAERNRPEALRDGAALTASQRLARANAQRAVASGRISAAQVAAAAFEAVAANRFFVFTHPQILPQVEARFAAVLADSLPADPYAGKPSARPRLEP
jgi:NAD(P)-dependent dehydrogenase (short-subunit alcohol dehydrogenase family)